MAEFLAWLGTHPFERDELNVLFWLCAIGLALIWMVIKVGLR